MKKKNNAMTFRQLMNTLHIKTQIELFDDNKYIGFYKMDRITGYDDYIVIGICATMENAIGVKIVKE